MKHRFLKTPFALLLGWLVPAAVASAAEPAPKLVHRPLPGLSRILPAATAAPRSAARRAPTATIEAVNPERARIVFIHRRATLPEQMTKDLAPANKASGPRTTAAVEPAPARQGRIKIIPKAEVATLLGPVTEPAASPKP